MKSCVNVPLTSSRREESCFYIVEGTKHRNKKTFMLLRWKRRTESPFFLATYLLLLAQSLSWIKNFLELLFYCSSKRNDPFPLAGRTGHHPRLSLHIHTKNKRNALYKLQKRAKKSWQLVMDDCTDSHHHFATLKITAFFPCFPKSLHAIFKNSRQILSLHQNKKKKSSADWSVWNLRGQIIKTNTKMEIIFQNMNFSVLKALNHN